MNLTFSKPRARLCAKRTAAVAVPVDEAQLPWRRLQQWRSRDGALLTESLTARAESYAERCGDAHSRHARLGHGSAASVCHVAPLVAGAGSTQASPRGRRVRPPPRPLAVLDARRRAAGEGPRQARRRRTACAPWRSPTTATCSARSSSTRRARSRASGRSSAARSTSPGRDRARAERADDAPSTTSCCSRRAEEGYKNLVRIVSRGLRRRRRASARAERRRSTSLAQHTQGPRRADGLHGRHASRSAILEQGEDEAARDARHARRSCFEPGTLYVELQDHGLARAAGRSTASSSTLARRPRPAARRDERRPLRRDATTARRTSTSSCIAANRSYAEAMERAPRLARDVPEVGRRDGARSSATVPRRSRTRSRSPRGARAQAEARQADAPDASGARGLRRADATSATSRARASSGASRSSRRRGQDGRRGGYRARLEIELDVICEMKFPGYFLIVWDFIRLREGERHPGRPGPRLGRRLARRVRAADHRSRSASRTTCSSSAS